MDKVTEYSFAIGTLRELKEGNLPKVQRSENYIKSFFNEEMKKKIILPNFVGVYQHDAFIIDNSEDCEDARKEAAISSRLSSDLSLARIVMNIEDYSSPSLINIIYDKRIMPEQSFIRHELGDTTGRIALSEICALPDFGMKNTAAITRMRVILTRAYMKSKEFENMEEFEQKHKETSKDLAEILNGQRTKYGLTSDEYTYLSLMDNVRDREKNKGESRIYRPCSILSDLFEYISKNKK